MAQGDEVEFVGIRYNSVAVSVQLLPRQVKAEGIVFKRAPVNAELKTTLKNTTGFKVRLGQLIAPGGPVALPSHSCLSALLLFFFPRPAMAHGLWLMADGA